MPQRLTVVLSQTPYAGSKQRAFEENLVPLLLLESHLDLTVVPHLKQIQFSDTGLLCLQGISGPMVLMSWLPPAQAHAELERCGVQGGRARHELDTEGTVHRSTERPIYFIDLNACADIEQVLRLVRRLRDELQVETISVDTLLGGLAQKNQTPQPAAPKDPGAGTDLAVKTAPFLTTSDKQPMPIAPPPKQPVEAGIDSALPTGDPDDSELDALLDELDRFH